MIQQRPLTLVKIKPGSRIVGSTTKVELTTVADCQSSLHRLVTAKMVCAIPGEVEEGKRRHHIMANHSNQELLVVKDKLEDPR